MIIILVTFFLALGKCLTQNDTHWGRLRTSLCSSFQLIQQSQFELRITDQEAIDFNSLMFDAAKIIICLAFSILGLIILARLFRTIKSISNHQHDLTNIPECLLKANINKIFLSLLLLVFFLCLFAQFSTIFENTQSLENSVKKTICVYLNFPNDYSRTHNASSSRQVNNFNGYNSQLRKTQKRLRQIQTSAKELDAFINQSHIVEKSVHLQNIQKQCFQLQDSSANLNTFLSQAREIIYFFKISLASLLIQKDMRWLVLQLPQTLTAIFTKLTIYSLLLIILSMPAFFRAKAIMSKQNCNNWFYRLSLFCIFFVPFCFLVNSTLNSILVPVTSSICRILDQNGYNHVLDYFPIDPSIKPTLQQLVRKVQYKSDGNLATAFDRRTIREYQTFLANSKELKQQEGQNGIDTNQASLQLYIQTQQQKIRNSIALILQNINQPHSGLNNFSLRVVGEYIESLQYQVCKDNLQIWSRIAYGQFCIAFNIICIIICSALYLLQILKEQKYRIYSSLEPEQTSVPLEEQK